jgi:radical SAM superfamily enzyme
MNFPAPLQILWRGKRLSSFNRVFKDLFPPRVYKIGLRMDFTRPNPGGKINVIGLESMHERRCGWFNQGHSTKDFLNAVERAKKRNLRLYARLIVGFSHETDEDILATAWLLNNLRLDGIKLHNLRVIKNTALDSFCQMGQVPAVNREEYLGLTTDFREGLDPATVVPRLSGETYRAPVWSVDKRGRYNAIYKTLEARDSWQGKRFAARTSDTSTSRAFVHQQGASL